MPDTTTPDPVDFLTTARTPRGPIAFSVTTDRRYAVSLDGTDYHLAILEGLEVRDLNLPDFADLADYVLVTHDCAYPRDGLHAGWYGRAVQAAA